MASQPQKKQKTYHASDDLTLTKTQAKSGGFRPDVVSSVVKRKTISEGSFRVASNPTKDGFSSGYHEAFVVTDMTPKLAQRTLVPPQPPTTTAPSGPPVPPLPTLSKMPAMSSGFWKQYSGKSFPEKNVEALVQLGDGARTDTARTILSAPKGGVAGHSGSGVYTGNQPQAHDLVRTQAMNVLSDPLMTPEAATVIASATMVYSIAPGELASKATGASKLKAKKAKDTWEDDRNQAKERVEAMRSSLSSSDQAVVEKHMDTFVSSLGDSGRKREGSRATSPLRERSAPTSTRPIQGGGYEASLTITGNPSEAPPTGGPAERAQYATAPFRVPRRT
jgi:hypothetical protein